MHKSLLGIERAFFLLFSSVFLSLLGFVIVLGTAYDILVLQKSHLEQEVAENEENKALLGKEAGDQEKQGTNARGYGASNGPGQDAIKANIQEPGEIGIGNL